METKDLINFLDSVIEAGYQARIFAKESVQQALQITELIKSKLLENDKVTTENLELKIKLEALESANKNYKERFADLDNAIEESKFVNDVSDLEVEETPVENLPLPAHSQNGKLRSIKKH